MPQVELYPLGKRVTVEETKPLLKVLVASGMSILQACGGQGRCATCQIHVRQGMDCLSPMTPQESITLSFLATSTSGSRLSCQAHVLKEGVVIELPEAMYIGSQAELQALIGKRAPKNLIHPITGEILVEEGKLIVRTALEKVASLDLDLQNILK